MKTDQIPLFTGGALNVIIETPKGSQNKFNYDPCYDAFTFKKSLPAGMVFPFDFGFVPGTKGEDGDPLDVLVLMEPPVFPGCVVPCTVIGVLKATQQEKDGTTVRNDRYIAVARNATLYDGVKSIGSLSERLLKEIESFFINYNEQQGKKFFPEGWEDGANAEHMIRHAIVRS